MKKLYFLDEQEKNRILNLHTEATKKQYLSNKKILNESNGGTLFKILNRIFKQGDSAAQFLRDLKPTADKLKNSKGINQKVLYIIDDVLAGVSKNIDDIDNYVNARIVDGKKVTFIRDNAGNDLDLDELEKYLRTSFKNENTYTKNEVTEFLKKIPNEIVDRNGKNPFALRDKLGLKLYETTKINLSLPSLPSGKGKIVKIGAGLTVVGILGISTYDSIVTNIRQEFAGDRKAISKKIDKYIKKTCVKQLEQTEDTNKIAQGIFKAGYMDQSRFWNMYDATDEESIETELEKINSPDDFCRVSQYFDGNYARSEYKNLDNKLTHQLSKFLDYEFTGVISDPVNYYQTYVENPFNRLLLRFEKQVKAVQDDTKTDTKSDTKDESNKPPKVVQKEKTEIDIFFEKWGFPETLPCLVKKCKTNGGCEFWDKSGYLKTNGLYYYIIKNPNTPTLAVVTSDAYNFKKVLCRGDEIIDTGETYVNKTEN
jgi:hypothetical protein